MTVTLTLTWVVVVIFYYAMYTLGRIHSSVLVLSLHLFIPPSIYSLLDAARFSKVLSERHWWAKLVGSDGGDVDGDVDEVLAAFHPEASTLSSSSHPSSFSSSFSSASSSSSSSSSASSADASAHRSRAHSGAIATASFTSAGSHNNVSHSNVSHDPDSFASARALAARDRSLAAVERARARALVHRKPPSR